jgi:RNA polymerase sigma-70 factor, ECF subfamily
VSVKPIILVNSRDAKAADSIVPISRPEAAAQIELDFSQIYDQNRERVRAVLYQIAGHFTGADGLDDLVQETFVRIWKGLDGYRRDAKLSSWIYRISVNTALDHLRSLSRIKENPEDRALERAISNSDQHRECETRDLVFKGLMALSDDQRTVLVLTFLHELPIHEAAEILEIPEGTVKSRLHHAKNEFRKFMSNHGVEI